MPTTDSRIDAYIAKAPAFAQPILTEVRQRIRAAVPDAEETIKWNVPFFVLRGKLLASMAAFKEHAKIGIWDARMKPVMTDVRSLADLPTVTAFTDQLKAAASEVLEAASGPAKKVAEMAQDIADAAGATAVGHAVQEAAAKGAAGAKATVARARAAAARITGSAAPKKKAAAKRAPAKKAPAAKKKAPARKAAPKKAAAKKAAPKKTAAKRSAAKKR